MAVSGFIKENRVLVAGLVLPLLLIGVLAIAKNVPSALTDPPLYKAAFYAPDWSPKGRITFNVNDSGQLSAAFNKNENYKPSPNQKSPETILYIYDPKTNIVHDTKITLGADDTLPSLNKFSGLKFSGEQTSPDGYIFEKYRYRNHSLITEVFTPGGRNRGPVLSKGDKLVKIPFPSQNYGNAEFLGWIIEGDVK